MRPARTLALIVLSVLVAMPLVADEGVIRGNVDCGKRCDKIMVYLEGVDGTFNGGSAEATFDQKNKVFIPHILPIVKGTKVSILNSDPFLHNVHAYLGKGSVFNIGLPANASPNEWVFRETGTHTILCDVHPEMSAYIVVLDNPFFSTVKPDGSFEIGGVPAGGYTAVLYHPERDQKMKQSIEVGTGPVDVAFQTKKR